MCRNRLKLAPCDSGEEDLKKNFNVFSIFHNHLPLKKGAALHVNKLENPLPKGCFVLNLVKIGQRFRRRVLNFVNVFSLFREYLPLGKGGALHLNKLESGCFVPSLVEIGSGEQKNQTTHYLIPTSRKSLLNVQETLVKPYMLTKLYITCLNKI